MTDLADPVVIGIVASPHGVHGTVRVREVGSGRHLRDGIEPVVGGHRRRILSARQTGKGYLIELEGVEDRKAAGKLRGQEMCLDRTELDEPEEGEFYVADMIGLTATDETGKALGAVEEVLENPGHEVLVVREPGHREVLYVPFTHEHVPEVDIEAGRLVLRPPPE